MNNRYRGGVLLTALLFMLFFSFLFSLVVEETQLTNHFSMKTQEFYTAKIIYSIFFINLKQQSQDLAPVGVIHYSKGELSYTINGDYILTEITVNQKKYQFKKMCLPNARKREQKNSPQ